MARKTPSGKKVFRVSEVITDHGSSMGKLLLRANMLSQIERVIAGFLDPESAAHFHPFYEELLSESAYYKKERLKIA